MLKDGDFDIVYASGENEPLSFFVEALLESSSLDLGLGYFSSSGFTPLSYGFAYFISCGGTMRLIINEILSTLDKEAIERGLCHSPEQLIEAKIVQNISKLQKTLSVRDRHFYNCLSWMIATNKLSLIAIVPKASNKGIAHQKFGIFKDKNSNKVAFTGSINFSETGLLHNLETLSCYRSWTAETERVEYYNTLFQNIWTGQNPSVQLIPLNQIRASLTEYFHVSSIEQLLENERELINSSFDDDISDSIKRSLKKLKIKVSERVSQAKFKENHKIALRGYQQVAVDNWIKSNYQGFFEMATGTGKTFTGLFASLALLKNINKCCLIILVPTISLAEQWKKDVSNVGYRNKIMVSSLFNKWDKELLSLINAFKINSIDHVVCICTYDSYKTDRFQSFLPRLPKETMLLADEAHTMGAPKILASLPVNIKYRLGLSATPHRHFDDSGTTRLLKFFNSDKASTYTLDLKEAIKQQFLCQYKLYPHFVYLDELEYRSYVSLSKRIARKAHIRKGKFEEADHQLEVLLRERRDILNKAHGKLAVLGEIIDRIQKSEGAIKHTLVYCPEGLTNQENERIIDLYGRFLGHEKGLRIGKFVGETLPSERQRLLADFDNGKIQCLLAMKCLDEGVDVRQTKHAIFLASSTNPRQYIQRRGRILRTHQNKSFAFVYDIIAVPPELPDNERLKDIEKTILRQELRRYKEFAEDSFNYVEATEPIKPFLEKYELTL